MICIIIFCLLDWLVEFYIFYYTWLVDIPFKELDNLIYIKGKTTS